MVRVKHYLKISDSSEDVAMLVFEGDMPSPPTQGMDLAFKDVNSDIVLTVQLPVKWSYVTNTYITFSALNTLGESHRLHDYVDVDYLIERHARAGFRVEWVEDGYSELVEKAIFRSARE